jgi:hypothetical protein
MLVNYLLENAGANAGTQGQAVTKYNGALPGVQ